jgi:hypothetical protein
MNDDTPRPVTSGDVLDAIRALQEDDLSRIETEAIEQQDADSARRSHLLRMRYLRRQVSHFRELMNAAGNPGLQYFGGMTSGPPGGAGFFERLRFIPEKVPAKNFWPLAIERLEFASEWTSPRAIVLTEKGNWWRAAIMPDQSARNPGPDSYYLEYPVKLAELDEPAAYSSIQGHKYSTTIDRAVVGSIAELVDEHGLVWPLTD